MGRLDAISTAQRPKMHGRAMLSGPSGAGKTWTSLSMATRLAADDGRPGSILVIDTEKESALTYADVFEFQHLPWRPPYDPDELADTLTKLGDQYAVTTIDSFSHFWRGLGGTLDIADGKFGGWKAARPVQERLVEAVLAMPCHVIVCVRSKMDYLVTQNANGKQEISKVGLAPIQDETLVYEMNVAMDLDLEHRITVTKSRTPAVPVGRMYPAGMEAKAADDYAGWLAGGTPPASREEVDEIVAAFANVVDAELRKQIKQEFVQTFGMPQTLTSSKVVEARAFLAARVDGNDVPDENQDPAGGGSEESESRVAPDQPADGERSASSGPSAADVQDAPGGPETVPAPETAAEPTDVGDENVGDLGDDYTPDAAARLIGNMVETVGKMTKTTIVAELQSRGKVAHSSWVKATLGRLLVSEMAAELGVTVKPGDVPWPEMGADDPPFDPSSTSQHPDDGTLGV